VATAGRSLKKRRFISIRPIGTLIRPLKPLERAICL
jgi:hypothetical protein